MINLLPPAQRKELRAARSNTLLFRYVFFLLAALLFLLLSFAVTYVFLTDTGERADTIKAENEARAQGYAQTQAQATELRTSLGNAKQLFDDEVRYSKALLQISALLPDGAAIESLELDKESFGQSKTFSVLISGQSAAEALRNNFSSSPHFSSVALGNVATNNESAAYPYIIEITVTMNRSLAQ